MNTLEILACGIIVASGALFLVSMAACLLRRDDRPEYVKRYSPGRALTTRQTGELQEARSLVAALLEENRRLWAVVVAMLAQWHQEQEQRAQWEVIGDGR